MKKFLVFPLWIFLGLLIPTILAMILPKFFNDNIGLFGSIAFILCQFIGFRHFGNIKIKELANDLVGLYFYKADSIATMSKQEILLRHNMHKNTQFEDLINLTFDELKARKIASDKEKRIEKFGNGIEKIRQDWSEAQVKLAEQQIKNKEELIKNYAEFKGSVAQMSSAIDEMKENYREAKKVLNEPSAFSVGFKKGSDLFGSTNSSLNTVADKKSDSLSSSFNSQNELQRDQDRHIETTASSSPIVSTPAKVDSFKAKNVVALSGAVVTWYEDGMMKYYNKCEACAAVETQSEYYTQAPMPGSALDSSFHCYKCRHHNKLIIKAV